MKDQDRRAVEGMARCGISLEGLIEAFPKFPASVYFSLLQRNG